MLLAVDPLGAFMPALLTLAIIAPFWIAYRRGWPSDADRRASAKASLKFFAGLTVVWIAVGAIALVLG
jgi:hypothetical protein